MSDPTYFGSPEEFRAWLADHHDSESEVFVGFYKAATGRQTMSWSQAVDQALCFGWIDGVVRRVDDERHIQRFTPRKRSSHWSKVNVAKVAALRKDGLMTDAGERAFAARTEANTGRAGHERDEPAALPPEYEARFRADRAAWAFFTSQAPWYQRIAIHLIVSAKREATREKRLAQPIEDSAAGRRLGQLDRR